MKPYKRLHLTSGMKYLESKHQPLAPAQVYRKRILKSLIFGIFVMILCLALGVIGYHYIAHVPWIDAVHNASMILSGMGPVVDIRNTAGKLFSSFYALFSGVVFITNIGVILAPAIHRFFHRLHVQTGAENS
jgi:hypothetical protein